MDPNFFTKASHGQCWAHGPKTTPSCGNASRPSAQTHILKSMFQKYFLPYPLKMPILYPKNTFFAFFPILAMCKSLKSYLLPHFSIYLAVIFRICQKYNLSHKLLFFDFLDTAMRFFGKSASYCLKMAWLGPKKYFEKNRSLREKF